MQRFLFILQYDSFIKTLLPVADALATHAKVDLFLYKRLRERDWIDARIRQLMAGRTYQRGGETALRRALDRNYDVAVIGSVGGRFIPRIARHLRRRGATTRLASGYVGALLRNNPTGFRKGAMRRAFTQLIWTPGSEARTRILNTGYIREPDTRVVATGLPRFDALHAQVATWKRPPRDTILFIEQPNFPKSRAERLRLVTELAATARAYPEHRLVIKPRFATKTGHAHRPKYLLPDLLRQVPAPPPNLEVCHDDLYLQFARTDFALSISSTGALEALLAGIPTYFIRDFCGPENRYGSLDFTAVGSVVEFAALQRRELPPVDFAAAHAMMRFDGRNCERLTQALRDLAAAPPPFRRRRPLPLLPQLRRVHPTAGLRARHRQPAELVALWLQPNVRRARSARAAAARLEQEADGALHLCPAPGPRRPRPAFAWSDALRLWTGQMSESPPAAAEEPGAGAPLPSGECSIYYCGDLILGLAPWPPAGATAPLPAWRPEQLATLLQEARAWVRLLGAPENCQEVAARLDREEREGGEIRLRQQRGRVQTGACGRAVNPPPNWLDPALEALLRDRRQELGSTIPQLFQLLDRAAWIAAAYGALARIRA